MESLRSWRQKCAEGLFRLPSQALVSLMATPGSADCASPGANTLPPAFAGWRVRRSRATE
jgi:hypothetical protein